MPKDPRTGSALGGFNQLTTVNPKTAQRSYSAREYYEPNAKRSNLSLLTNALVSKIEFEERGSGDAKATGVSLLVDGASHTIKVNKEVIVCGGVVNSPQILELSGVGSPEVLSKAGIEVVVDNPGVGENLNDHTATGVAIVSRLPRILVSTIDKCIASQGRIPNSGSSFEEPRDRPASNGSIHYSQSWPLYECPDDHRLRVPENDRSGSGRARETRPISR